MKKHIQITLLLIINILTLYLGSILSNNGPSSIWYQELNKAPWTPPGWIFGTAWVIIMICFSFYLLFVFEKKGIKEGFIILIIQMILNVIWNPIFFYLHNVGVALLDISLLLIFITSTLIMNFNLLKYRSLLLSPYVIWLTIATSLNLYIFIFN